MRPCAEIPYNGFGDLSLPTLKFLRTYANPYNRDVEDFCVHAQKFLIMISENKVLHNWIICAYTQILNRDEEVFCVRAQKFLIAILDNKVFQRWIICAYTQILGRDMEVVLRTCA